jgi:hypothetical protein
VVEGLDGKSILPLADGTFSDFSVDPDHPVVVVVLESISFVLGRGGWIIFEVGHVVICYPFEVIEVWDCFEQLVYYCHRNAVHYLFGISDAVSQGVNRQVSEVVVNVMKQCLLNLVESQELLHRSFDGKSHPPEFLQLLFILAYRSHLGDDDHYLLSKLF